MLTAFAFPNAFSCRPPWKVRCSWSFGHLQSAGRCHRRAERTFLLTECLHCAGNPVGNKALGFLMKFLALAGQVFIAAIEPYEVHLTVHIPIDRPAQSHVAFARDGIYIYLTSQGYQAKKGAEVCLF